ncbi:hypothetical protein R5R35_010538 [Gryllus longicercus]|uniref:Uncharacterized protein n=1 Tax=Gryllus longicercus TaxID=2509291 RepID=A0AAN9VHC4_9ORTH
MDMDNEKRKDSFTDVERILNRYNEYVAEHEEMIHILEHMERDLQRTIHEFDSLKQVGEDSYYYRVSGMPKMKVRDVLPYLQQEKIKKEKEIANFRKKIVQQNEEMTEFKKKHLKLMDPKDMPSTSYAESP